MRMDPKTGLFKDGNGRPQALITSDEGMVLNKQPIDILKSIRTITEHLDLRALNVQLEHIDVLAQKRAQANARDHRRGYAGRAHCREMATLSTFDCECNLAIVRPDRRM